MKGVLFIYPIHNYTAGNGGCSRFILFSKTHNKKGQSLGFNPSLPDSKPVPQLVCVSMYMSCACVCTSKCAYVDNLIKNIKKLEQLTDQKVRRALGYRVKSNSLLSLPTNRSICLGVSRWAPPAPRCSGDL